MFFDDIWRATRRGDLETVRKFIERDGIPNVKDDYDSQSLLTVACEAGHVNIVRFLLEKGRCRLGNYEPCAFAAFENGHIEVLRVLFEFGLEYWALRYDKHDTPLIYVALDKKQEEVIRLCVEYGANLEEVWYGPDEGEFGYDPFFNSDDCDLSPLEIAVIAGRTDLVEIFLETGVSLQGQSAESYLEKVRENELLRLEFEAAKRSTEDVQYVQSSKVIEYDELNIGDKPWPNFDANRINEDGEICLLKQENKLDEERPEKRARLECELRIIRVKRVLSFLHGAALIFVSSPFIIFVLLVWGIVSLILFIKDKILTCFKSNPTNK